MNRIRSTILPSDKRKIVKFLFDNCAELKKTFIIWKVIQIKYNQKCIKHIVKKSSEGIGKPKLNNVE